MICCFKAAAMYYLEVIPMNVFSSLTKIILWSLFFLSPISSFSISQTANYTPSDLGRRTEPRVKFLEKHQEPERKSRD
jgi:hypothetical protein